MAAPPDSRLWRSVSFEAQVPRHTFGQPVPVVFRIVWEHDGEEQFQTVVLGWTGRNVYVRVTDPRYRLSATWLDASDIQRR